MYRKCWPFLGRIFIPTDSPPFLWGVSNSVGPFKIGAILTDGDRVGAPAFAIAVAAVGG